MKPIPLFYSVATLNKSTQDVYYVIRQKAMVDSAHLQKKTKYGSRTIRAAIRQLISLRLIRRIPNLHDMRSCYYEAV
ncbi:MAG: hypothetical protein ACFFD1_13300 [Candidatus Thorarchaeota archaeon]